MKKSQLLDECPDKGKSTEKCQTCEFFSECDLCGRKLCLWTTDEIEDEYFCNNCKMEIDKLKILI